MASGETTKEEIKRVTICLLSVFLILLSSFCFSFSLQMFQIAFVSFVVFHFSVNLVQQVHLAGENPDDHGCMNNWVITCWKARPPSKLNYLRELVNGVHSLFASLFARSLFLQRAQYIAQT